MTEVYFAEVDRVYTLDAEVHAVLTALHRRPAFVSDETVVEDLCRSDEDLAQASQALGVPIGQQDLLWHVAQRIRDKR